MLFTVGVVGKPRHEQYADGWVGLEVQQQPRADDPVFPGGGKCEAQRGDHRDGDEGHVYSVVTKTLKEKEIVEVGIRPVLKRCFVKLLVEQGLAALDQGKQTPSIEHEEIQPVVDALLMRPVAFFEVLFLVTFLVGLFVVALGFTFDVVIFSTIAVKSSGSTGS